MMRQSTRKRVALATGAGSATGIGFAIAKKLAQNGFAIVITSTTERVDRESNDAKHKSSGHGGSAKRAPIPRGPNHGIAV